MVAVDVITEVWVPGEPKTKGSLTFRGNGYVEENVKGSARWRRLVASAVRADLRRRHASLPSPAYMASAVPVGVRLQFWLPASASMLADRAPVKPGSGDVDKLVRNVLDALTDAHAYVDDVQVVRVIADKMVCTHETPGPQNPGVLILAWAMTSEEVRLDAGHARLMWGRSNVG